MKSTKKLSCGRLNTKRSLMDYLKVEICGWVFKVLMVISIVPISHGFTDPRDVFAINSLYVSLGYPPIFGWIPNGGDPCLEAWQGVQCVNSNITAIILNGANLGGRLGDNLESFASIIAIDLRNNHIGGSVPSNLPLTMRNFFLSDNQLTGSIPTTIPLLSQLTDMSLSNNLLTGEIPDAFQSLAGLFHLDLSGNNLSGQLPPSLGSLSSLITLHLQNNHLSGTLDVLEELPLMDLNVENNLFSGPIPEKLLRIPNFKKDGNPFNITIAPSSPIPSPLSGAPSSEGPTADGPSTPKVPDSSRIKEFFTTKRIIWIPIAGVLVFIIVALGFALCCSRCCKGSQEAESTSKRHDIGADRSPSENSKDNSSFAQPNNQIEKVPKEAVMVAIPKSQDEQNIDIKRMTPFLKQEDHGIDITVTERPSMKSLNPTISVRSFSIASLQQYTNSFSQENHIGRGMLGSVYRAELSDGKPLAIKKLDNVASRRQKDEDFLELVSSISKIQHANIVQLVGYCAEHGQRLLMYEYCRNGTLHDALHSSYKACMNLSWNSRIRMALGAARSLEYLHEFCQPPVVHQNFKSANILLDDKLEVRISDCGLAPFISSDTLSQLSEGSDHILSAYRYGASEFESGTYTHKSDVYSFGVVMLELLTGRKSYDRSQPRGKQFLVGWVVPQLHDIDALSRMVDPSLNGAYPAKSLSRFADIISLCVQPVPEFRPPMSEIVQALLDLIERELQNKRLNED